MYLSMFAVTVLAACLVALLAAVATAVLARMDGATRPAALLRAGVAFGGTLSLLVAILALGMTALR
ncbi:hypothetical protein [Streptacidiphilus sp. P02-A3a]|uniref:hypothetical protein n=1 Tax=Streptacidiphilus sp. P02-A3a TaxID=2704468 RepID=UPI0015F9CDC4|nr:hypothetical protein [Streptacidiphilus sp. P02-A3a]QMU69334.1 hypothetical protein GXP74_14870 [Streptacidiphilus sp. P02-A3a]